MDGEVLQNLKRLGRKDATTKVRLLVIFLLQAFVFPSIYCMSDSFHRHFSLTILYNSISALVLIIFS